MWPFYVAIVHSIQAHSSNANAYMNMIMAAAIQDIEDGLADMAVGPFWISGERLLMTSFTVPLCELTRQLCSHVKYDLYSPLFPSCRHISL